MEVHVCTMRSEHSALIRLMIIEGEEKEEEEKRKKWMQNREREKSTRAAQRQTCKKNIFHVKPNDHELFAMALSFVCMKVNIRLYGYVCEPFFFKPLINDEDAPTTMATK